jgi:hypothetical protein
MTISLGLILLYSKWLIMFPLVDLNMPIDLLWSIAIPLRKLGEGQLQDFHLKDPFSVEDKCFV